MNSKHIKDIKKAARPPPQEDEEAENKF